MNSDFQIFLGKGYNLGGFPLAIAAVYSTNGGRYWHGEYYILITGQMPKFYAQHTSIDARQVPEDLMVIDNEFMFVELSQQITAALSSHLFNLYKESNNELYVKTTMPLIPGQKADLARLWMRGEFENELKRIKQITQCECLSSYLSDVVHLPPVKKHET